MRRRRCDGLTLVEVLVVMAILTILFALVLSVMAPAKNRGKNVTCINNLRQLFAAQELYYQDYSRYGFWSQLVASRVLTDKSVLLCPFEFRGKRFSLPLPHSYACQIPFDDETWACFRKRGPEYPISFCDLHRIDKVTRAEGQRPYVRLIRMGGNVDEIDWHGFLTWFREAKTSGELPCDGYFSDNF